MSNAKAGLTLGSCMHRLFLPGVRFPGIIHPGLIGTAPSAELLAIWNEREKGLVDAGEVIGPCEDIPTAMCARLMQRVP